MPTITSAGTGNWSAGATWVGGVAPTAADDVVIASPHAVTLNTTGCAALSVVISSGGTLRNTNTTATLATGNGVINQGTFDFDLSASNANTFTLTLNTTNSTAQPYGTLKNDGDAVMRVRGFPRNRISTIAATVPVASSGTQSVSIPNVTGWQVGDRIIFATTQAYSATPAVDVVTVTAIAGNLVSWNASVTPTAYSHAAGGYVGNFSSNVVITRHPSATNGGSVWLDSRYKGSTGQKVFSDVLFSALIPAGYYEFAQSCLIFNDEGGGISEPANLEITSCPLFNCTGGVGIQSNAPTTVSDVVYYSTSTTHERTGALSAERYSSGSNFSRIGVFQFHVSDSFSAGIKIESGGCALSDSFSSGAYGTASERPALLLGAPLITLSNVEVFSSHTGLKTGTGTASGSLFIGRHNGGVATNGAADIHGPLFNLSVENGGSQTLSLNQLSAAFPISSMGFVNRDGDVAQQEIYRPFMSVKRENTTKNRSTSSIAIGPTKLATASQRTLSIPCAAGSSVRVIGYVQKSDASNVAATVALTGLGSAWGGFTAAANTSWQVWDTGSITNSSGVDGNFLLTYTATSSSGLTNVVYFDGVPDNPFVTKCRHYGFTFDESNPARVVNPATAVSVEDTALAYTGVTINTVTPQITVGAGTTNTFKKLYDYTQAWACQTANLPSPVFLTSTDGNNFALPTTCRLSWPTMGADGTLVGGRLLLAAVGTHTYKLSGTLIEFQAVGTYSMGATTFSGTVELVNTSGGAVTVQLPAGTSYTNTGPSITVEVPTVTQGLDFTGLVAGSQVVVYTTGTTTELFRDDNSGTSETWSRAGGTDATVDYTIQRAGRLPIRVVGVTVNSAVLATPIQQVVDRSYVASAGLTFTTNCTLNAGTKIATWDVNTTGQNFYSFAIEAWIAETSLRNVAFPFTSNGPNSFTFGNGWEVRGFTTAGTGISNTSLSRMSRDGLRYVDTGGTVTAIFAALYSVDTAAGLQIRYQQTDGGTTVNAAATGPIDQLIQVFGGPAHGNFDRRSWLTLKVQADGYDQAETNAIATYGNLEDQLYVIGLNPVSNGLPTGAPTVNGSPAITDHGASPVTWNAKQFSITITDSAAGNSGQTLMRWIRYNLSLAPNFQGIAPFNWHDLVQTNGSSFKTVRGAVYGDTGAALKGVRVVMSDGTTPHPGFNLFTADDGTTYAPPPSSTITLSGITAGSRVQLYDTANGVELLNSTSVYTYSETYSVDRTLRVRIAYQSGAAAKNFIEANIGSITSGSPNLTYIAAQTDDTVYNTNGVNGATVAGITISDGIDRLVMNIAGGSVSWPQIYAYNVHWLTTMAGIVDDGSIITATDNANYRVTLFKIRNSSTTPLSITGGFGVDSGTGTVGPLIDTAGSTGNIYQTPDHVVPYQTTGSYAITGDISTVLAAIPTATANADAVWAKNLP